MPATTTRPIIRTNWGSRRRISRVFAYDPTAGRASVRFADGDTDMVLVGELEAIEADMNTFADLDRALRDAAHEVIE